LILNSHKIQTNHFIMKKLLLFAFVFSSLLASAQQEIFEFLRSKEYKRPNKTSTDLGLSFILKYQFKNTKDSKGRTWNSKMLANGVQIYNNKDTVKFFANFSPNIIQGYNYNIVKDFIVDEKNTKLTLIQGSKNRTVNSYVVTDYDSYIIKCDSLGNVSYLMLRDFKDVRTNEISDLLSSINNKVIFSIGSYLFFEGDKSTRYS